jgi:hypothetical protein
MKANLYATFRLAAGEKSITLETDAGWTVLQVVDEIIRPCSDLHRLWVKDARRAESSRPYLPQRQ